MNNVTLSFSANLANASQQETISTGSTILSSSASNAEGTVTYSLTDADNKFAIDSSTGQVTLANALDYETKTSHTFTVTATDGTTTTSQTYTLNITDVAFGNMVVNQYRVLEENANSGPYLLVTSLESDSGNLASPTYSITAGNESGVFTVVNYFSIYDDSSGATFSGNTAIISSTEAVDFETAKSYTFTLTATENGETTSTNVVVPVFRT